MTSDIAVVGTSWIERTPEVQKPWPELLGLKNVWGHSSDLETHTVETHIYRLRKKMYESFKDDNFIKFDKKGYFLS